MLLLPSWVATELPGSSGRSSRGASGNKRPVPATGQASRLPSRRPRGTALASRALAWPRPGAALTWPPAAAPGVPAVQRFHSPRVQRPTLQGSGGAALRLLGPGSARLSRWGWAGPGRREPGAGAAGKGLWPLLQAGALAPGRPTPLCAWPGSQSQPLWWPLPPGGTQACWGSWPPPASKGKFLLPKLALCRPKPRPKPRNRRLAPGGDLSLSWGVCCVVPPPPSHTGRGSRAKHALSTWGGEGAAGAQRVPLLARAPPLGALVWLWEEWGGAQAPGPGPGCVCPSGETCGWRGSGPPHRAGLWVGPPRSGLEAVDHLVATGDPEQGLGLEPLANCPLLP